jgi:hypothetical protein
MDVRNADIAAADRLVPAEIRSDLLTFEFGQPWLDASVGVTNVTWNGINPFAIRRFRSRLGLVKKHIFWGRVFSSPGFVSVWAVANLMRGN